MSVIIRLQNLPWSANAADIRAYFAGLSIPEGGVHIIGGDEGDAFIAFSTDEDARQAMQKDNGKIKEVQIKLLLSSRAEMVRVIELARQQSMKLQSLMSSAPAPVSSVPSMNTVFNSVNTAQNDHQKNKSDMRRRDKSSSRERDKSRRSSEKRDRTRGRSHRDRRRRSSRSSSRSRSRDRHRNRRSKSRDRKRSKDKDSKKDKKDNKNDFMELSDESPNKLPDPPAIPDTLLQINKSDTENVFPFAMPGMMSFPPPMIKPQADPWQAMGMPMMDPQLALQRAMMTNVAFPGFPANTMFPPNEMWRMNLQNNNFPQSVVSDADNLCVEVRGLPFNSSYIDIIKLFDGLMIPQNGIKIINDTLGNRTGIAYVKFNTPNHKLLALNQNSKKVRSNVVEVLHLRDSIYETAIDNFKPERKESEKDNVKTTHTRDDDPPPYDPQTDFFKTKYVHLKGLPNEYTERDIENFFSAIKIKPIRVSFVFNNHGLKTGEAYAFFEHVEEANRAVFKDNSPVGRYIIGVTKVTEEEVHRKGHFVNQSWSGSNRDQNLRFMPSNGPNGRPFEDRFANSSSERRDPRQYSNERFDRHRNQGRPPLQPDPRARTVDRWGNPKVPKGPRNAPPPPLIPSLTGAPPFRDTKKLDSFGSPGCVVAVENLHYRVEIDEIIDFFSEFGIKGENVIRRFDDFGRPTGDARVSFKTPADAEKVVKDLNYKSLKGRNVKLTLLD